MALDSTFRRPEPILSQISWITTLGSPDLSLEELIDLIPHASVPMLERIAENPAIPWEILEMFATWDDAAIRAAVAENPICPYPIMVKLSLDESPDVRYRLAESPHVPVDLLEAMMEDENCYVAVRARRTVEKIKRTLQQAEVRQLPKSPTSTAVRAS